MESVPCGDMTIRLQFDTAGVDWAEAAEVLRRAPLVAREPGKLRRACENSYVVCFAFDGETLAGMARAISDGEYLAGLFDLVVLPEYQGKGIGKQLMSHAKKQRSKLTLSVYKENEASYQFYLSQDFTVVSEQPDEHTGHQEYTMSLGT